MMKEILRKKFLKIIKLHPNVFSRNLRALRDSKKITQIAIANYLNIARPSYTAWETGIAAPRPDKLRILIELLQIDPGELIDFNTEGLNSICENSVPLLNLDFFKGNLTALGLAEKLKDFSGGMISCDKADEIDFAVNVNHRYYSEVWNGAVNGSLIFCSASLLKDKKDAALYEFVSGRVVLVKIIDGAAGFRCARFNGQTLKLTPLNPYDDLREFPIGGVGDKPLDDASPASFRGWATSASSVRILAVPLKLF